MELSIKSLRQTSPERISLELSTGEEIKATVGLAAELRLYAGKVLEEPELEALRSSAALALCKNRGMELRKTLRPLWNGSSPEAFWTTSATPGWWCATTPGRATAQAGSDRSCSAGA